MAKATVKMPEDFLLKLSRLGEKTDEITARVLEAGGAVSLEKVKANLQAVIGSGTKEPSESTGELLSSLGLSKVRQDKDGNLNIKVGFSEPRSDGKSNAMIASVLEYGKSGQPPKPFLQPAKTASRKPCIEAMKAKLESELESL